MKLQWMSCTWRSRCSHVVAGGERREGEPRARTRRALGPQANEGFTPRTPPGLFDDRDLVKHGSASGAEATPPAWAQEHDVDPAGAEHDAAGVGAGARPSAGRERERPSTRDRREARSGPLFGASTRYPRLVHHPEEPRRPRVIDRWSYRFDRFLGHRPVVQPHRRPRRRAPPDAPLRLPRHGPLVGGATDGDTSVGSGLWWAITRILDGGTVAVDTGAFRRVFGVIVTVFGLVSVAILTGAFASSFAERIQGLRRGTNPIFERGHLLFLGWSERGGVIARELAISMIRTTIVVLTSLDREIVEERIREAIGPRKHRLRVIVRRGDPMTTAGQLERRGAHRERRPRPPGDRHRRGSRSQGAALAPGSPPRAPASAPVPAVVEVQERPAKGAISVRLTADPERGDRRRGPRRQRAALGARRSTSPRRPFEVVRQILSLDARSFFVHSAAPFAKRTFDEAHAAIDNGVLCGDRARWRRPSSAPTAALILRRDDSLIVFSDFDVAPSRTGSLPAIESSPIPISAARAPRSPGLRYKPELASLLGFIDERRRVSATIVVAPADLEATRAALGTVANFARRRSPSSPAIPWTEPSSEIALRRAPRRRALPRARRPLERRSADADAGIK